MSSWSVSTLGRALPVAVVAGFGFCALPVLALAQPLPPGAGRTTIVDCALGQKISPRLTASRVALIIKGTCIENVVAAVDDVSITTDGVTAATIVPADPNQPTLRFEGSRRVVVDGGRIGGQPGLTINGGSFGIVATRGAAVDVRNCLVTNTSRNAISSNTGSTVVIDNSRITGNAGNGVGASNSSSLFITNSFVGSNALTGIFASRSSYVRVGQNIGLDANGAGVAAPVTVSANGTGVSINESSSGTLVATEIASNTGTGVAVTRASSAQIGIGINGLLAPNNIHNNGSSGISVFQSSQALIRGNIIQDHPGGSGVVVTSSAATIIGNQIRRSGSRGVTVHESGNAKIGVLDGNDGLLGNLIESNSDDGVGVFTGAAAVIGGNTIQSNANNGVEVHRAVGRFVGGNTIQLNTGHGISIVDTSSMFQGQGQFNVPNVIDTVQNNTLDGVNAFNGSSLDIQNILIQNNGRRGISLSSNASAQLLNSTIRNNINDGISLFTASTLTFPTPSNVVITGNTGFGIQCFGAESSFGGDAAGVTGNAGATQVSCTGF